MSALIKQSASAAQNAVRPALFTLSDTADAGSAFAPAPDTPIALLEREVAALSQTLADERAHCVDALAKAREEGRIEGELAAERDDAQRLGALQAGIETALDAWRQRLSDLDALALLLCQTSLERVFGDANAYRDLVTQGLARQLQSLRDESVLAIAVSGGDFPDDAALKRLSERSKVGRTEIRRDPQLASGACCITLRLGRIELSIPEHWDALQKLFRQLAGTRP